MTEVARTATAQGSEIPLGWKPTAAEPLPVVRCVQIKKDGQRCARWSLRGTDRCVKHGGQLPNVKGNAEAKVEAARMRLVENLDLAVDVLEDLMQPGTAEAIRLKAAESVMDRTGLRGGFEVQIDAEVTVNPADTVKERLAKLSAGAQAVAEMQSKARAQRDDDDDIIDAEVVPEPEQDTLF